MRVAIVGGGVIGLLTAVHCVSAGHEVVLVDQAGIPFSGATSYDRQRVIRALHAGDPATTRAAVQAHDRWIDLQGLLSAQFYEQVGALTVLRREELGPAQAMLAAGGARTRALAPADLAAGYPQVRFPAGASAVLEPQAGVLLADRVLLACARWLRQQPRAELRSNRTAVAIEPDGTGSGPPAVMLADGEVLRAGALLLAIGPWSRALLGPDVSAQLRLRRQSMIHCALPAAVAAAWSAAPVIRDVGRDRGSWVIPPVAGTPLTFSSPGACRVVPEIGDSRTPPYVNIQASGASAVSVAGLGERCRYVCCDSGCRA